MKMMTDLPQVAFHLLVRTVVGRDRSDEWKTAFNCPMMRGERVKSEKCYLYNIHQVQYNVIIMMTIIRSLFQQSLRLNTGEES